MPISILFWVVFILWYLSGLPVLNKDHQVLVWGNNILLAILIGLLGWHVFGGLVH